MTTKIITANISEFIVLLLLLIFVYQMEILELLQMKIFTLAINLQV